MITNKVNKNVITKNLNCEILTKNLVIWDWVKDVKFGYYGGSLKNQIFTEGFTKSQCRWGNCLKRGAWTIYWFKRGPGWIRGGCCFWGGGVWYPNAHYGIVLLSITKATFITRLNACHVFWNWRGFYILIKLYSDLYDGKSNFAYPRKSASDSDKDGKRGREVGLQSNIDWVRRTQYLINWDFTKGNFLDPHIYTFDVKLHRNMAHFEFLNFKVEPCFWNIKV